MKGEAPLKEDDSEVDVPALESKVASLIKELSSLKELQKKILVVS